MKLTDGMYIKQDRDRYANKTGYLYRVEKGAHKIVAHLSPMQVLAYRRHYPSITTAYEDGNGRWHDCIIIGDFPAYMERS